MVGKRGRQYVLGGLPGCPDGLYLTLQHLPTEKCQNPVAGRFLLTSRQGKPSSSGGQVAPRRGAQVFGEAQPTRKRRKSSR